MSALVQAPLVQSAIGSKSKVLVLTSNAKNFLAAKTVLLQEVGVTVDDPSRFVVQGVEDLSGFEPLANPKLGAIDTKKAEASLVAAVRACITRDVSISSILLECTELPPYEDALRKATSLPVFSVISLFTFFYNSRAPSTFRLPAVEAPEPAVDLPPARDEKGDLRDDARERVQRSCEKALASVRELVDETLVDSKADFFIDVREPNIRAAVWSRLRLLDRVVPALRAQTTTETINEVPLAGLNIHVTDLWTHYLPLACSLHERYLGHCKKWAAAGGEREAFVVGINAPPGCGKSTLVQLLKLLLRTASESEGVNSLNVVHVGSDDLYMTKAQRKAAGISSRLKIESIDVGFAETVLWALKRSTDTSPPVRIPRFNKGTDEREPEALWSVAEGRVDIVLFEGWRVGVVHPLYKCFNDTLDCLVCIEADIDAIRTWKLESGRRDAESAGVPFDEEEKIAAFDRDIKPFVEMYETPLVKTADLVMRKAACHSIMSLDRKLIEKLETIAQFQLSTAGELTIEFVEKTLANLGMRSASRWVFDLLHRRGVSWSLPKSLFVSLLATAIESSSAANKSFYFRQQTTTLKTGVSWMPSSLDEPFRCASGYSSLLDTQAAVNEAAGQLEAALGMGISPSLLVFHATVSHDAHALRKALIARYPGSGVLHGASSCQGVMTERGSCTPDHGHALALFAIDDRHGVYSTGIAPLSSPLPDDQTARIDAARLAGEQAALRAKKSVEEAVAGAKPDMLLLSATPNLEEHIMEGIASIFPGVPIYGGSAADDNLERKWFVCSTEDVYHGDAVLLTAMYTSCHVAVSLATLHKETAHRVLVTKLGADSRTIAEIDHKPAAERLAELGTSGDGPLRKLGVTISHALEELRSPTAGKDEVNIQSDSSLCPLARASVDGDGTRHFQLIHPSCLRRDGSVTTFAAVQEQEELVLLSVKSEGELAEAAEGTARAAVDLSQLSPTFGEAQGALLIYCAGCFMALRPHMASVAERIKSGLPSPDGKDLPFVCGFTFGEQGPVGIGGESVHCNLMFNICLFGGPKVPPPPSSQTTGPPSPNTPSTKSIVRRVRDFLLQPENFQSMSQMLHDFDADGDTVITPDEFDKTLRRFGFQLTPDERQVVIDAIDRDQNGQISYSEMFRYLQGVPRGRGKSWWEAGAEVA